MKIKTELLLAIAFLYIAAEFNGMKKLLLFILLIYVVLVKAQCTVNITAEYNIICNSQKNQLIAAGATSYSWHPQPLISSSINGDTVVVQPSISTIYTVTGTTGTCTATNTVLITVNACTPPKVGFTTNGDTTCVNNCIVFKDSTQYHSTKPLFYTWYFQGGTITPVAGSSIFMDTLYYSMTNSTPLPNVKVCYHTTSSTGFFLVTEKVTNGIGQTGTYTDSVMVTICAGIEKISDTNLEVNVNPNPSAGVFTIETNIAEKHMVFIFDVNGKLVFNQFINGKASIDARSLNAGVYSLNITSNHGSLTKKLVIVK